MSEIRKISCDGCGADLTSANFAPRYRLSLWSELLPQEPGPVACVLVYPPIREPAHFCGLECLGVWLKGKMFA